MNPPRFGLFLLLVLAPSLVSAQNYRFPTTATYYDVFKLIRYFDEPGKSSCPQCNPADPENPTSCDWHCGCKSAPGHNGVDFGVGGFDVDGSLRIRDVVAAAPGIVGARCDGDGDRCTSGKCAGPCGSNGNFVRVDHPDGKQTFYVHLKKFSVVPNKGEHVACGQKLGEVGSSGFSTGPHLHFGVHENGVAIDPFKGPCGSGRSYWTDQGEYGALPALTCDTGSFQLVSPEDGERFSAGTRSVGIAWSVVPDAAYYDVRITEDRCGGPLVIGADILPSVNSFSVPVQDGHLYYWQIRAKGPGIDFVSECRSFVVSGGSCTARSVHVDDSCSVCNHNGVVEAGEECDDGNTINGDCCSANCTLESCDDGDDCTTGDKCNTRGQCVGTPRVCNSPGACEANPGTCDAGVCNYQVASDGTSCPTGVCRNGACVDEGGQSEDELLTNRSFETLMSGWVVSTDGANRLDSWWNWSDAITGTHNAHTGSRYQYLGADQEGTSAANRVDGLLYQDVDVPPDAVSASLSYYLRITTKETVRDAADRLKVEIRNTNGAVLETVKTYSNLDAGQFADWTEESVDLDSAYAGTRIRIAFHGTTDASVMTVFRVDDVSLEALVRTCDPNVCASNNRCVDAECVNGQCIRSYNRRPCSDRVFCNGAERCRGGSCQEGDPPCTGPGETCDESDDRCVAPSATPTYTPSRTPNEQTFTPTETRAASGTPTATPTPHPTASATRPPATACIVGDGTGPSCTEVALDACLPGGSAFGGIVTFRCGEEPKIIPITASKEISESTRIDGGSVITISGENAVPIFAVAEYVSLAIQNIIVANGASNTGAGGIQNYGALTVDNTVFYRNRGIFGGGIRNSGTMSVTNVMFSGNIAAYGGGGGIWNAGVATIANSTFWNNFSEDFYVGGGIYNSGKMSIANSSFFGNAAGYGGAILNFGAPAGSLTVASSSFFTNSATYGSAMYALSGLVAFRNSIVANSSPGDNCAAYDGGIADGGHNIDDGTSCNFSDAQGSASGIDPKLDPAGLANNGGLTFTIAIQAGSPAIDSGDPAFCAASPVNNRDQRGYVRPGNGATTCSVGAFEYNAIPALPTICAGDCDGSGDVAVNEVIVLVNMVLGNPGTCQSGLPAGVIPDVSTIVQAVSRALGGCS